MKQYRLKKDLPNIQNGVVESEKNWYDLYRYKPELFPDWFEEEKKYYVEISPLLMNNFDTYAMINGRLKGFREINKNYVDKKLDVEIQEYKFGFVASMKETPQESHKELVEEKLKEQNDEFRLSCWGGLLAGLSDEEIEIIKALRKAKDIKDNFTLTKSGERICIWDELTLPNLISNCYIFGATITSTDKGQRIEKDK